MIRPAEKIIMQYAWDNDLSVRWEDDWEVGSHIREFGDTYVAEPDTCETATLIDAAGDVIGSLSCIDDADDAYRKEIKFDLIWEVMPD